MPDPRLDDAGAHRPARQADRPDAARRSSTSPASCAARRKGEGLGNQFLANIREVDAIAHVVRCFEDPDVVHVAGAVDPLADIETIETELMLADLDSLEKRLPRLEKRARGGDKEAREALGLVERALALLREGKPARWRRDQARGGQAVPACSGS